VPLILISIGASLIEITIYSSVSYLVLEKHYGAAWGILASINNFGLLVGALVFGIIVDNNSPDSFRMTVDFDILHAVLISCGAIGFVASLYLNFYVETYETILNAVVKDFFEPIPEEKPQPPVENPKFS